ncbi:MAG: hypothetical protein ABSB34_02085 [Candidatus Limnocylindrales bacterium]|jgi:hypothetical protein
MQPAAAQGSHPGSIDISGAQAFSPAEQGAARQPEPTRRRPAATNTVIFALVIALHDVARRRGPSNMSSDVTSKRTTP